LPEADTAGLATAHEDLALLRDAARQAGAVAMRYFGKDPEVWMKGGTSPVSEADYAADAYLRETLLGSRPDYGWLSEETSDDFSRLKARRAFVVDPIDGTRAFLEGNSTWCVSVAVVERGRSIAGVLECPAKGETYWAVSQSGAFLNGNSISVRNTGSEMDVAGPKAFLDQLPQEMQKRIRRVTYVPSLAYRLAMIAAGVIDASFVKPNSHDWDIAAAALILTEAGGKLLDASGNAPQFAREEVRHGALAAGSGDLLETLSKVIAGKDIPQV
jgi:myo-inositol-1(or 4)-monophosphatase